MTDSKSSYKENLLKVLPLGEFDRLLILRTAQWPVMENLFAALKEAPSLEKTLLIQRTEMEKAADGEVHRLPVAPGPLSFSRIGRKTRKACRDSKFDAVLIPLSRNSLEGYENVFSLIPLLTKAPAYAVDRDGVVQDVTRRYRFGMTEACLFQILKTVFYPFGTALMIAVLALLFVVFKTLRFLKRVKS